MYYTAHPFLFVVLIILFGDVEKMKIHRVRARVFFLSSFQLFFSCKTHLKLDNNENFISVPVFNLFSCRHLNVWDNFFLYSPYEIIFVLITTSITTGGLETVARLFHGILSKRSNILYLITNDSVIKSNDISILLRAPPKKQHIV